MRAIPCPVTDVELRRLYEQVCLTDSQIAALLGSTAKRVRSWRARAGIGVINRTARHVVPEIEGRLKSILVGSMLGDGRLSRGVHTTRFVENHSLAQRAYAEWKRAQWGSWVKHGLKPVTWTSQGEEFPGVRFETVSHVSLNGWQELFYYGKSGPKCLKPEILPIVAGDALALTVWYLDDGSAEWWPTITMAASQKEVARDILLSFGLDPDWRFSSTRVTTGFYVLRGEDNAHRFIELVRPHIPECMAYKLEFGFQGVRYQKRMLERSHL